MFLNHNHFIAHNSVDRQFGLTSVGAVLLCVLFGSLMGLQSDDKLAGDWLAPLDLTYTSGSEPRLLARAPKLFSMLPPEQGSSDFSPWVQEGKSGSCKAS